MALVVVLLIILGVVLLGWVVVGLTLNLLGWILTGLIVGALARLVLPGSQALGWLATILYGIGGALIGGVVADILDVGSIIQFLLAVASAAVLIAVFATGSRRVL